MSVMILIAVERTKDVWNISTDSIYYLRSRNCNIVCNKSVIEVATLETFFGAAGRLVTGNIFDGNKK